MEPRISQLTPLEREIVSLVVLGYRDRRIASELSIDEATVKQHLRAVFEKVGVSDRLELVLHVTDHKV